MRTVTPCALWVLTRAQFKQILMQSSAAQLTAYVRFLEWPD